MKISNDTLDLIKKSNCVGCKACMKGCPMLDKYCESPKDLLEKLLNTGNFDYNMPYSCMLCGYCTRVCPTGIDLKSIFLKLRVDTVNKYNGKLPKKLGTRAIDFHQRFSFSNIFTSNIENLQSETIFFPGCGLMSYSPYIVETTYYYLRSKLPGIGIYNKCCGKPTAFMGKEDKFKEYYSILEKEFKSKNVKRIITGCQNCFMTIGYNSKEIRVISLWQVIAEMGIPKDRINIGINFDSSFTIHDPCPTRDIENIHDSVRSIINQMGFKLEEMKYHREKTLCCGSGGMVPITQNNIAITHMERRANEGKTDYIITYCQECVESMRKGGKRAYHILDLLFNHEFLTMPQENLNTITKWTNRYKGRKLKLKKEDKQ